MKLSVRLFAVFVATLIVRGLLGFSSAQGADLTWTTTNPNNTVWTAAGVWDGPATWSNGDNASFNNSPIVNLGSAITIGSTGVTIAGGQTLTLNLTADSKITGTGGFTGNMIKTGGNLRLSHSGGFNGTLRVDSNYLIIGSNAADPTGQTSNLTKLNINGGGFILGSAYNNGTATIGELSGTSGTIRTDWTDGGTNAKRTLVVDQATDTAYSGTFVEGSSGRLFALVKAGSGALTLNSGSAYTGGTVIQNGKLVMERADVLGSATSGATAVTVNGGTLDISFDTSAGSYASATTHFTALFGTLTMGGIAGQNSYVVSTGTGGNGLGAALGVFNKIIYDNTNNGGTATISAPWITSGTSGTATREVQVNDSSATAIELDITGQMSNTGMNDGRSITVQKTGTGTLRIAAANYFPRLDITAGKVIAAHANALGTSRTGDGGLANLVTVGAATLEINGVTVPNNLTLNNGATLIGTGTAGQSTGTPSIGAGAAVTLATTGAGDQLSIGPALRNGSGATITAAGSGTIVISGGATAADAYAGAWRLTGGTLRLSNANALGNPGGSSQRPIELAGGLLQLNVSAASTFSQATTVTGNATITPNGSTADITHTLGTLNIGGNTLAVYPGSNVPAGTQGLSFGATTLTGNTTFEVNNTGTTRFMQLNLASVTESSGSRSLTKTGTGRLFITGPSTLSGTITVRGDNYTGEVSSPSAAPAGKNTFLFIDTASFAGSPAVDLGTASDKGDLILGGALTGGTLTISSITGAGKVRVDTGGAGTRTLEINQSTDTTFSGGFLAHYSGGGASRDLTVVKDGAGTLELTGTSGEQTTSSGAGDPALNFVVNGGTLRVPGSGDIGPANITSVTIGSGGTLEWDTASGIRTVGNSLSGTGTILKSSGNNLVINGANSFSGTYHVAGGYLVFDSTTAEDGKPSLDLAGGNFAFGNPFAGGTCTIGALSGSGDINTAFGGTAGTRTLSVDQSVNTIFSGTMADAGTRIFALAKDGAGTLALTGNNGYTGGTTIAGGTLQIGNGGGTGDIGYGAVTVSSGATLEFNRTGLLDYKTNAKMRNVSGGGDIVLDGGATLFNYTGSGIGFHEASSWDGFSGNLIIQGGSEFQTIRNGATAMGSGTITLGDATTSGNLSQIEGNWTWTNPIDLVGSANTIKNRSAGAPRSLKLQGVISGSGGLTFDDVPGSMNDADLGFILTGANTMSGAVIVGAAVRVGGVPGESTSTAAGTGGSLGTASVTISAGKTLTFSRTDSHTVASDLSGSGLVRIGSTDLTGTENQTVIYTGNNSVPSTIIETGTLQVGAGGLAGSISSSTITGDGHLVFNRAGSLTYAGTISGSGDLTKSGSGVVTLTAAQGYTGATTINGGELELSGAGNINSGAGLTIDGGTFRQNNPTAGYAGTITFGSSGGTVSGTGTIDTSGGFGGLIIGPSTVVSPGNSPGLQTYVGSMVWTNGGTYHWEINDWNGVAGVNWDLINLNGGLSMTNTFTIEIASLTLANTAGLPANFITGQSQSFPILQSTVGLTPSTLDPSMFNLDASGFGFSAPYASWSIYSVGDTIFLQYTAMIPEPTTVMLLGFGSLLLLVGRRLRKTR